jgi:hypothetical protein
MEWTVYRCKRCKILCDQAEGCIGAPLCLSCGKPMERAG